MVQDFLAENRKAEKRFSREVMKANDDWEQKFANDPMDIEYDPEGDYLWIRIGKLTETIAVTSPQGFVLLVDAETKELRGAECPLFLERVKSGHFKQTTWGKLARHVASIIDEGHNHVYIPPESELRELQRNLGQLVPA